MAQEEQEERRFLREYFAGELRQPPRAQASAVGSLIHSPGAEAPVL